MFGRKIPVLVASNMTRKCPDISLEIFSGFGLKNVEMQARTVVSISCDATNSLSSS